MRLFLTILAALLTWGCTFNPPGYDFYLADAPASSTPNTLRINDNYVDLTLTPYIDTMRGVDDAYKQYMQYRGFNLTLINKSGSTIILDWNRAAFLRDGTGGYPLMHRGINTRACRDYQKPSVIPAGTTLMDHVVPCYAILHDSYGIQGRVDYLWLPSPRKFKRLSLGLYLPLTINGQTKEYTFNIIGISNSPATSAPL